MTEHRLGPEDAGRTIEVAAGDRLVLGLAENPGTGFTWTVEELPESARVLEERYEQAADAAIGAASRHIFVVEAPKGGTLRLSHGRPWEGEAGVTERYEVTAAPTPGG